MKHKSIRLLTSLFVIVPGLPAAAQENGLNTFVLPENNMQYISDVLESTSDIIDNVTSSIEIEKVEPDPVDIVVEEYYTVPVYTSYTSVVENTAAETDMASTPAAEVQIIPEDTSVDFEALNEQYQNALTVYQEALNQYNEASVIVEKEEQVEVQVTEEVTDEEGNISSVTTTEVQTVTTTETAGDVNEAQAALEQASLNLMAAENALSEAQTSTDSTEETYTVSDSAETESVLNAETTETTDSSQCGDSATWSMDDAGVLTISGTGDMYDYTAGSDTPWYAYKLAINHIIVDTGITRIGDYCFNGCDHIDTVYIYDTTTSIGAHAFDSCTRLTGVHYGNGLTTIEEHAFNKCSNLNTLEFGTALNTIEQYAFSYCTTLEELTLPDSVVTIGKYAFNRCWALTDVDLGSGLQTIGSQAFYDCKALESIVIPASVTNINYGAFNQCVALQNVTLNEGLLKIGNSAFNGCTSLLTVTIPKTVTSVGVKAFESCSSLTAINVDEENTTYASVNGILYSKDQTQLVECPGGLTIVTILDTVTSILQSAFSSCDKIIDLIIPETVISIGMGAFYKCSLLNEIVLPDSITELGAEAFYLCQGLTSAIVGSGIISLASKTFSGCKALTSVILDNTLTGIDGTAFEYCDALTDVYYRGTETDWVEKNLYDFGDSVTIHYMADYTLDSRHSLSLDGNIGVNFYFLFSDEIINDNEASVEFTVDGTTSSMLVSDADVMVIGDNNYRKFTVEVTSVQMTSDIFANVFTSAGDTGYEESYSVKTYCDSKLSNTSTDQKLKDLMIALLNYGGYAQIQFDTYTDRLANADLEDTDVSDVTADMLEDYQSVITGSVDGLTLRGSTLTLNSLTTIKHYFIVGDGHTIDEYTFQLDGETLVPVHSGSMYYVEIPNISSKDLDTAYTVTAGDFSITYSALSYAYNQLSKTTISESLKNACQALYKYNAAADAYFN